MENYRRERQDKTPTPGKNPPTDSSNEDYNCSIENMHTPPSSLKRSKTKRGLASDFLEQENSPLKKELFEHHQLAPTTVQSSAKNNTTNFFMQSQPISFALSSAPKSPIRLSSAPRSPMRIPGSPLALLSNNHTRSLLEERLNQRRTLSDITPPNGQTLAPSSANTGSIGVLLAAAAKESTSFSHDGNTLVIAENGDETSRAATKSSAIIFNTPPSSPMKTLKPKKRWLKTAFQEGVRQTPNETDENLAMPIRWNDNESEIHASNNIASPYKSNHQYSLFKNPGSNVLRRSPLSLSIASTLVALHSSSPDKENNDDVDNCSNNQPLNLSKKY